MPQSGKTTVPTCLGAPNQSHSTKPRVTLRFRRSGKPPSSGTSDDRFTVPPHCVCTVYAMLAGSSPEPRERPLVREAASDTSPKLARHRRALDGAHPSSVLMAGPSDMILHAMSEARRPRRPRPNSVTQDRSRGAPAGTDPTSCCCLSCPTAQSCQTQARGLAR